MKKTRYLLWWILVTVFSFYCLSGCKVEETDYKRIKDLDYTICDESKLPDALIQLIHEKKTEPFKLTYKTKDYLYIVVGYGAQDRADLCINLQDLYVTKNANGTSQASSPTTI